MKSTKNLECGTFPQCPPCIHLMYSYDNFSQAFLSFAALLLLCIVLSANQRTKKGRPGNKAKIAVFVHTSSVLSLEHSVVKKFLILSWYQRTFFLSIYAGTNYEDTGGKCTFHAERWNSVYIIYCWMNSGNKRLAVFMCCIHALILHPQDVR